LIKGQEDAQNKTRNGGFQVVMVCQEHVLKGLHLLPAPHVKEMDKNTKECCIFCHYKAKYELFLLNSSKQSSFLTENQLRESEEYVLV
jgi:hypothetical protein